MSVLIFAELDQAADGTGSLRKSSLEAIFYGAQVAGMLGTTATALVIGSAEAPELELTGNYGATKVLHATAERLAQPNNMAYATVLAAAAGQEGSSVVIIAKSSLGDAVAARAAGKLKAGLVSNVVDLPEGDAASLRVKRSIYTGKAFAITEMKSPVKIITIRKNAVAPQTTDAKAAIEAFSPTLNDQDFVAQVTGVEKATGEVPLTEADIIVSGGRGMRGPENWGILEDLAHALHAATGCSKPVSDLDWRPHHEHIGQTGIKVSPNLYVACGISGAIQHLAGVNGSKVIVVINKDAEAPFFKAADYGIVGDVFDILPRLTKAVQSAG
ncbi:MAG: electron transfer flavoprotein subunit alpha/FixB family protein [Cytophagaceae bacterium]|nr:electron transfer flavoprotein subunit alpha/FixB family protein [Cytophagaceae bacterium]